MSIPLMVTKNSISPAPWSYEYEDGMYVIRDSRYMLVAKVTLWADAVFIVDTVNRINRKK